MEEPTFETKGFQLSCCFQADLFRLNLNNLGGCVEFITSSDDVRFIGSSGLEDRLRRCVLVGGQAGAK